MKTEMMKYADLDTLLKNSDVVSLHCPLSESTREIINRDAIAKMKDGAMLINTSRGGLINEEALCDALNSGKLTGAAVDVVSVEPIPPDNVLLGAKNIFITPHIAWASRQSRQQLIAMAARQHRSVFGRMCRQCCQLKRFVNATCISVRCR